MQFNIGDFEKFSNIYPYTNSLSSYIASCHPEALLKQPELHFFEVLQTEPVLHGMLGNYYHF